MVSRIASYSAATDPETMTVMQAQERTYRVMLVLAGNLEGFEEALRALYRRDRGAFVDRLKGWPGDVREHVAVLAEPVFAG